MAEHIPDILNDSFVLGEGILKMSVLGPFGMDKKTSARLNTSVYFHNDSVTKDVAVGDTTNLQGKKLYVSVRLIDGDTADDLAFAKLILADDVNEKIYEQELAINQYDVVRFGFLIELQ